MSRLPRPLRAAIAPVTLLVGIVSCSSTPDESQAPTPPSVTVTGAVRRPGRVEIPSGRAFALVDALTTCGNFTEDADPSRIRVTRNSSTGRIQVKVSYDDIVGGRRPDFQLRPDDVIFVPQRGR